jgi:hypothetical protein
MAESRFRDSTRLGQKHSSSNVFSSQPLPAWLADHSAPKSNPLYSESFSVPHPDLAMRRSFSGPPIIHHYLYSCTNRDTSLGLNDAGYKHSM